MPSRIIAENISNDFAEIAMIQHSRDVELRRQGDGLHYVTSSSTTGKIVLQSEYHPKPGGNREDDPPLK